MGTTTFIHTKNKKVIKQLEAENYPLLTKRPDGVHIYALPPTSSFVFENQKDTYLCNKLIF